MRLLFVCPDMDTGGAERHWSTLIRGLAARGVDVHLLALAREGRLFGELQAAGVGTTFAAMSRRTDLRGLRRALRLADFCPDVVVSRGVSGQVVGAAIARRARASHAVNEHTPCLPDGRLLPPALGHQEVLTRLVAPRVHLVVAVTEAQVAPLAERGYRGDRIRVVPNGVFPQELRPRASRQAVRSALDLRPEDFAALSVAGLRPEKRVDTFVQAIALARRSDPRVRGLVAGTGRELERIRRLAGEAVELLGEREDVPDLIEAADAVCLTSMAEALPMILLETMALARPVVASRVGGTPEAVVPGETGFLVEPGDEPGFAEALLELSADAGAGRRLGEAGRMRQRELFDGERMVDGYLEAFEQLATARATAAR